MVLSQNLCLFFSLALFWPHYKIQMPYLSHQMVGKCATKDKETMYIADCYQYFVINIYMTEFMYKNTDLN